MHHQYLRQVVGPELARRLGISAAYLLLAALIAANSGCLLIAAGAAGGAAAGYAYCKGKVCDTYNAAFNDAWAATHTALNELGMPVVSEEHRGTTGFIRSTTADGERVRIYLEALPSRIPADGQVTRICVRVATFGDHPVSNRVLDQVGLHLAPANALGAPPPPPPGVTLGGPQTAVPPPSPAALPQQTPPPPLLPAEPAPIRK